MVPEKATAVPVIKDAAKSSELRVSPTRTPKARASSSLTISKFKSRAITAATATPKSTKGSDKRTSLQREASNPPASQNSISRWASRFSVNKMMADMMAAIKALTATPESSRADIEKRPPAEATA